MNTINNESARLSGKVLTAFMATLVVSIMVILLMVNLHNGSASKSYSGVFNVNSSSISRSNSELQTWMTMPFDVMNTTGEILTDSYVEDEILIEPWMTSPF